MRRRSTCLLIVMMVALSVVAPIPSAAQEKSAKAMPTAVAKPALGDFDDFVNQALKDWKVPGVAVAVVQGDKVLLLKGTVIATSRSSYRSHRTRCLRSARLRNHLR